MVLLAFDPRTLGDFNFSFGLLRGENVYIGAVLSIHIPIFDNFDGPGMQRPAVLYLIACNQV